MICATYANSLPSASVTNYRILMAYFLFIVTPRSCPNQYKWAPDIYMRGITVPFLRDTGSSLLRSSTHAPSISRGHKTSKPNLLSRVPSEVFTPDHGLKQTAPVKLNKACKQSQPDQKARVTSSVGNLSKGNNIWCTSTSTNHRLLADGSTHETPGKNVRSSRPLPQRGLSLPHESPLTAFSPTITTEAKDTHLWRRPKRSKITCVKVLPSSTTTPNIPFKHKWRSPRRSTVKRTYATIENKTPVSVGKTRYALPPPRRSTIKSTQAREKNNLVATKDTIKRRLFE